MNRCWRSLAGGAALTVLLACSDADSRRAEQDTRLAEPSPTASESGAPAPSTPSAAEESSDPFAEADGHLAARRWAEAEAAYHRLAQEARDEGDAEAAWRAALGQARAAAGMDDEAGEAAGFAAAEGLAQGIPRRLAATLYHHATSLLRRGELETGLALAERCHQAADAASDPESLSLAYGALGTAYSLAGRYSEALEVNERRVELWRRHGPGSVELAVALNNVAIDYRHFGRFEESLAAYEEARQLAKGLGEPGRLAMVLYNLANVYSELGETGRARELKLAALEIVEPTGNLYGLGLIHGDLGDIYRTAGNREAARRHLEEALAVHRRAGQPYGEILAREQLARLDLDEGALASAEALVRQAMAQADAQGFGKEQTTSRTVLARVLAAAGRVEEAQVAAGEALARARELGDPAVELEALTARAIALEASGLAAAAAAYLDAIELLESWRGRLALGDLSMAVGSLHVDVYEGAIRTLLARQRTADAFDVAERFRARRLLELLAARHAQRGASARQLLAWRLAERERARQKAEDTAQRQIEAEITSLVTELEELEAAERRRDPRRAASRLPRPASLEEVRAGLSAPRRRLLALFWGEREVYAWWLGPHELTARSLGAAPALRHRVELARALLADPASGETWREPTAALGRLLLGELLDGATAGSSPELTVVADGPLAAFPFEVFPLEDGEPLGAHARISYGPSASVLLALRRAEGGPEPAGNLLAVGLPGAPGEGDGGTTREGSRLEPLPFAAREVRSIARLFPRHGTHTLVGEEATLERWLGLGPGGYRYLHFAAHAVVSARTPGDTRILLAGDALRLPALQRLDLDADLVTLSACDTGLGRPVRGEGIVGLPHAFLAAGARGAVVSLWRVEDRASARFMTDLYTALTGGAPPAEALRRARIAAGAAGDGHPARWAPFVLIGAPP